MLSTNTPYFEYARCALLGKCDSYGMPSSHAQVVAYIFAISLTLKLTSRVYQSKATKLISTLETAMLGGIAIVVGYARVHLGYHTVFQTVFGGVLGFAFGILWAQHIVSLAPNKLRHNRILRSLGCCTEAPDSKLQKT